MPFAFADPKIFSYFHFMPKRNLAEPFVFHRPAYIGTRQYTFENEEGQEYCVQFVQKKTQFNAYIVDLSIRDMDLDEYFTTNFGDVFRVMATVVEILIDFIEHAPHATSIEFVPVNESDQEHNRRLIVFERYAKIFREITHWKYKIDNTTFTLYKS